MMETTMTDRVIVLVDMDCFYVQVEQKLTPGYENKPCAVVQYNTWQGGGIIAVNYEARAFGVKRGMRGNEAKTKCPGIHLFQVPEVRGKADLTRYREAGASVIEVLCEFSEYVERASVDEAYVDLTTIIREKMEKNCSPVTAHQLPNTFVVGLPEDKNETKNTINIDNLQSWLAEIYEEDLKNNQCLALAAVIVETMRATVLEKTTFRCSAGIAHNKMLAKLACGLHKPNKQTVLPQASVPILYTNLPINKVRNLGGKLGQEVMDKLHATTMADLMRFPETQLQQHFGEKTGTWLHEIAKGIEDDPVISRQLPKSIGCGKNFPAKTSLNTKEKVKFWLHQLASELEERLQKDQRNNKRVARSLTVSIRSLGDHGNGAISRTCPICVYDTQKLVQDAFSLLQQFNTTASSSPMWNPAILSMALSASRFEDKTDTSSSNIQNYFSVSKISPLKTIGEQENVRGAEVLISDVGENRGTAEQNEAKKKLFSFVREHEELPISKKPPLETNIECTDHTKNSINIFQNVEKFNKNKKVFNRTIYNYFCATKPENSAHSKNPVATLQMPLFQKNDHLHTTLEKEVEKSSEINEAECSVSYANLKSLDGIKYKELRNETDQDSFQKYISYSNTDQISEVKKIISAKPQRGFFAQKLEERQHVTKSYSVEKNSVREHSPGEKDEFQVLNFPASEDQCSVPTAAIDHQVLPFLPEDIRKELEDSVVHGTTLGYSNNLNDNKSADGNNLKYPENDSQSEYLPTESNEFDKNDIATYFGVSEASTSNNIRLNSASGIQMFTGKDIELIPELNVVCKICGHSVPVWEEQEHADFHIALQLQSEDYPQQLRKESEQHNKHTTTAKLPKSNKVGKKRTRLKKESSSLEGKRIKHQTLDFFMK